MALKDHVGVVSACLLIFLCVSCSAQEEMNGTEREVLEEGPSPWPFPVAVGVDAIRFKRFPAHLGAFDFKQWIRVGECPQKSSDGMKLFYCPSLTPEGEHACVDDHQLCNGFKECPNAEDEDVNLCFFHKTIKARVNNVERAMFNLKQMLSNQLEDFMPRKMRKPARYY